MNNRHRRVERLRSKYATPSERKAWEIIDAMINTAAEKLAIEQMCRPGKVELEDFENLKEVAE